MKIKKKVVNKLKPYYLGLKETRKTSFRNAVMTACEITEKTFYRWIENPSQIKRPNRLVFVEKSGKSEKFLFPGIAKPASPDAQIK